MIEPNKKEIILSIETAVQGGSLAILANGNEVDGWRGTLEISKAEDFLEQIANLLRVNNVAVSQIKMIVISKGAGISTGQKIGIALAKGLRKSLKCDLTEISITEALLLEIKGNSQGQFLTAAVSGKNHICWELFEKKNGQIFENIIGPLVVTNDEFCQLAEKKQYSKIVFSSDIEKIFSRHAPILLNEGRRKIIISKQKLAFLIGLKALNDASDNVGRYKMV